MKNMCTLLKELYTYTLVHSSNFVIQKQHLWI